MPYHQTVNRTIHINAPPSAVWQTLTNPDLLRQWRSPDQTSTVASDWQLNSPILFEGIWDRRKYLDRGTILAFDPPHHLTYNIWSKLSRLPDEPENYTIISFTLTPSTTPPGTTLHLTHTNFQNYAIYGHANFYWATALHRLKNIAETNPQP